MNSLNHYALGAVGEFMYQRLAGIDVPDAGGAYRTVRLRPVPAAAIGWCKASHRGHLGTIASEWRCEGGETRWEVELPPNEPGEVELPASVGKVTLDGKPLSDAGIDAAKGADGGLRFRLESGRYAFTLA